MGAACTAHDPGEGQIRELYDQAHVALNERNRIVHSLAYFDGDSGAWLLIHPKTGFGDPMPTPEQFEELRSQLNMLWAKCLHVERQLVADSVRTDRVFAGERGWCGRAGL